MILQDGVLENLSRFAEYQEMASAEPCGNAAVIAEICPTLSQIILSLAILRRVDVMAEPLMRGIGSRTSQSIWCGVT